MNSKTITVIGNIGSGKSTIVANLARSLPAVLINADPYDKNPFLELYSSDHARWSLATELFFTLERANLLEKELSENEGIRLIDSGLLMGIDIYANHHLDVGSMTLPEWELYNRIVSTVVSDRLIYPDLVIILNCEANICLSRIKERGRAFEGDHKFEYLISLEHRINILKNKLIDKNVKVLEVNTEKNDFRMDKYLNKLLLQIEKLLK